MTLSVHIPASGVAVISLNRPDAANALNTQMALDLKAFFASANQHRAIVLTGAGRSFCAGADLKERQGMSEAQWHTQHQAFEGALHAILDCPVPVIAAVNGAAFAGGLELALACDFIYAADTARFAFTEVTLGIMPGLGGTQTLARRVGLARAKELILSGRPFSAQDALQWDMINKLCDAANLPAEALACAQTIAANAPLSIRAVKAAMNEGIGLKLDEALACELRHYQPLLATGDRHEGINAWKEKRKPVFSGS